MTQQTRDALKAVNAAQAKLDADQAAWDAAQAVVAQKKTIFEGIRDGGLAAAQATYNQALIDAKILQDLVEVTDTVAFRVAEIAFDAATSNPGSIKTS